MTHPAVLWDTSCWNDEVTARAHLDATAYRLASDWFVDPSLDIESLLVAECPGFSSRHYGEAISRNLVWARR